MTYLYHDHLGSTVASSEQESVRYWPYGGSRAGFGSRRDAYPPEASWSPDSRWLVYHRCMLPGQQRCYSEDQYAIFKLNIETGEEWLLVEGGINPYWRLTPSGAVE